MDITLLIITLALLDVGMICCSLYLDHQIAKLKDVGMITDVAYPGMLIAMKEAEKHDDTGCDASGVTQTDPENRLRPEVIKFVYF